MFEMGACMSSNNEEVSRKKHSQAIDKQLEEDSKRLRRECKILLLGTTSETRLTVVFDQIDLRPSASQLTLGSRRVRRERQVDDREADEDHPLEGLL